MKNILRVLLLLVILFTNYQLFAKSSSENELELKKHLVSDNSIPFLKIIENTKYVVHNNVVEVAVENTDEELSNKDIFWDWEE